MLSLADAETDGELLSELDGDGEDEGLLLSDADGELDAEPEMLADGLLDSDADGDDEGEPETDADGLSLTDALGDADADALMLLDGEGDEDGELETDADGELDGLPRNGKSGGMYRARASSGHRSLATIAGKTTSPTTGGHLIFAKILGITRPTVNSMESWQPHLAPRR